LKPVSAQLEKRGDQRMNQLGPEWPRGLFLLLLIVVVVLWLAGPALGLGGTVTRLLQAPLWV
jgi:hypothetical protein